MSTISSEIYSPFGLRAKALLAVRVWRVFVRVRIGVARKPLPAFAHELGRAEPRPPRYAPALMSRAVHRSLAVAGLRPRCLIGALVLYRLLREQGDPAELVIGLPPEPRDQTAHAWVELDGMDVGPPPGRGRHSPIARFS